MAGLKGNIAWFAAKRQTARGTAAAPLALDSIKAPFSGGSISPTRETDNLAETDSARDRGLTYVQRTGVEGSPELYVRDRELAYLLYWALGAVATTGTTPNYSHTITPANSLPYVTFWRDISDTLYERFEDCMVTSLSISADAGAPLTATVGINGRRAVRLTTAPTPLAPLASSAVYNFNEAAVTLGGGATSLVSSFELTIENNVTAQQTDDSVPYDVVPGTREVSVGFDLIFETLDEYNKFHYGGAAGTAISPTIYTTSAEFTFSKGANNELTFNLPSIAYEELPVEPDPGGDPIVLSCRASAQRGASPVVTATVKNQEAAL